MFLNKIALIRRKRMKLTSKELQANMFPQFESSESINNLKEKNLTLLKAPKAFVLKT